MIDICLCIPFSISSIILNMTLNSIINETNYKLTISPTLLSNSNLLNNCKTFLKDFYFHYL